MLPVAIDTETGLATNSEPVPRLASVALASERGCQLFAAHDPAWVPPVVEAYAEGAIFANGPFDNYVLLRAQPALLPHVIEAYEHDRIADVLTREKLIDIAEGFHFQRGTYGLGPVAYRRAGVQLNKQDRWRKLYLRLLGLEIDQWPEDARAYAIADAAATWATWYAQEQFRARHQLDVFADAGRQARGHLALYAQTLRGVRTDPAAVDELDQRLLAEIVACSTKCLGAGLVRVGGTKKTPKLVRNKKAAVDTFEQFCRQTGRRAPRTKPTAKFPDGQVSLSETTLNAVGLREGHPLDAYRRLGGLQTTRTKNLPVLRRPLIRTRYDECVGSGRTSSSGPQDKHAKFEELGPEEWVGTNLQNQQRAGGFRECLVAPPGHVFVISDWSGAELVALGQVQIDLFGRSALANMIREGRDPHSEFGAQMLAIPIEQFDRYNNPEHKKARQAAKPWNFGKPGGMGARRFIEFARNDYGVELTPAEERRHTATWHSMLPEMQLFFDYVSSLKGPDGLITIVQPRSGRIRGRLKFTDACNTHFQGLAADAAKLAMWWLWLAFINPSSPLYGGQRALSGTPPTQEPPWLFPQQLVSESALRAYQAVREHGARAVLPDGNVPLTGEALFVHDENVTVVRREVAEAAKVEQERIMIAAFGHWCPDVPVKVESTITERYMK